MAANRVAGAQVGQEFTMYHRDYFLSLSRQGRLEGKDANRTGMKGWECPRNVRPEHSL